MFQKRFYNRGTLRGIIISRFSNRGNHFELYTKEGEFERHSLYCTQKTVNARINFRNIYYKLKNQMQFLLCFHNL